MNSVVEKIDKVLGNKKQLNESLSTGDKKKLEDYFSNAIIKGLDINSDKINDVMANLGSDLDVDIEEYDDKISDFLNNKFPYEVGKAMQDIIHKFISKL